MLPIIIGFILDLIIGDPNNPLHPVRLIGSLALKLEALFRKAFSKNLKLAGGITWIFIVSITFFVGLTIINLSEKLGITFKILIEGLIIYFCISSKGLKVEGLKVINILNTGDIDRARQQLSYIVGRDTKSLNEESIIRAVVETVAENMSDGIIAPLFFAGIGGAPLALAYKAINTCDSMFGYKNDKYIDFGFVSAKMDDLFNYIPARLTAYFIICSSYILGFNYKNSLHIYKRDRYNHKSPNSAHPEAAVAGALGIKLGGANYYFGKLVEKPTIGDSLKNIEVKDVYNTNKILMLVSFMGVILALTLNYIGGLF